MSEKGPVPEYWKLGQQRSRDLFHPLHLNRLRTWSTILTYVTRNLPWMMTPPLQCPSQSLKAWQQQVASGRRWIRTLVKSLPNSTPDWDLGIVMSLPTIGLTRSSYLREQRGERGESNTLQISLRIPRISSFRYHTWDPFLWTFSLLARWLLKLYCLVLGGLGLLLCLVRNISNVRHKVWARFLYWYHHEA